MGASDLPCRLGGAQAAPAADAQRRIRRSQRRRPLAFSSASSSSCCGRSSCSYLILILVAQRLHLAACGSSYGSSPWLSPVAVGFRSALSFTNRNKKRTTQSKSSLPLSFLDETGDNMEEEDADRNRPPYEYAFALERDKARLFSAQSAYLHECEESAAGEGPAPRDEYSSLMMGSSVRHAVTCSTKSKSASGVVSGHSDDATGKESMSSGRRGGSGISQSARGGASTALLQPRPLMFWENMVAGAISRSIAQTIMHPANTLKTMLQTGRDGGLNMLELLAPQNFRRLTRGAGANFILSVPHGAVNFAVLEFVRSQLSTVVDATPYLSDRSDRLGPTLDFVSSAISTITCSIVSTPQMVIADNIMAGNYPNLLSAIRGLAENRGVAGFYTGWWPGLVGKIPSYALTWTFFQQLKEARDKLTGRPATDFENTIMGCVASGATVCIMIPLDTIKTRLVTQSAHSALSGVAYKGIIDCAVRVAREEGVRALYRGLTPRLVSVVPMIGIQFGVYEFMKKTLLERSAISAAGTVDRAAPRRPVPGAPQLPKRPAASTGPVAPAPKEQQTSASASSDPSSDPPTYGATEALQEAAMEVAASPEVPFPAPRFLKRMSKLKLETKRSKSRPSAKAKQQ